MHCPIWYYLYNSKNVKKTHGGVLLKPATLLRVTPLHGRFSSFFINGTKSRKASDYKHHRSMKKWVKRENWNIENKWNIFHATFNVIFFSPVLIFKNIKIEVKKEKSFFWGRISCSLSLNYKRPSHSGGLFVISILNFVFERKNELI